MNRFSLGLRLESLGLPFRQALAEAARIGVGGVQIDAVGDLAPDTLSQSGRRALVVLLRTHNLELSALGCPLRRGLDAAENQEARLEHIQKVMTLAYDLGPGLVILSPGQVPEKEDTLEARRLREGLTALTQFGDRSGTRLAWETGLESGEVLASYLATYDTGSLAANLDPANLLLHNFDPFAALRQLAGKIAHTHARDGRKGSSSRAAREVPLGHGDIDWLSWCDALEEVEYHGWLVVEREEGDNKRGDVEAGVTFLRRIIGV
jgi:sugar phosphate isomerase/epimerase